MAVSYFYRYPTDRDLEYLSKNLKSSDRKEVAGVEWDKLLNVLKVSRDESDYCTVALGDGVPLAIWGIKRASELASSGIIWLLSTEELKKEKVYVAMKSRKYVKRALLEYDMLYNYVSSDNEDSIRWLKWLGAKLDKPKAYGIYGLPYCYFKIERE